MNLPTAIRIARIKKDTSQKQLANKAGINSNYLSLIECKKRVPNWKTVVRIANALDMSVSELAKDVTE